jgi:hypothetical protein
LTRADLSGEAIRLGRLLYQLLPEPEVAGLLALMLLHESRRAANWTRTTWHIRRALNSVAGSAGSPRRVTPTNGPFTSSRRRPNGGSSSSGWPHCRISRRNWISRFRYDRCRFVALPNDYLV